MTAELVSKYVTFCDSPFGKRLMQAEADYVRRELQGCKRVLDVGCGIGVFEEKLPEFDMVGLDSSAEMLSEARTRCPNRFVEGQASHLDFADGSFDAALFVTSLEFMDDCRSAIDEAARIVKPGGRLLVLMLNPESEYFAEHARREGSYFKRIKHTDPDEILDYVSQRFAASGGYFLGIIGEKLFDTTDAGLASLYVIKGTKPAAEGLRPACASGAGHVR